MARKLKHTNERQHASSNAEESVSASVLPDAATRYKAHQALTWDIRHAAHALREHLQEKLAAVPEGDMERNLHQFLTDIAQGASPADAAQYAGFTTRETLLAPAQRSLAKARIVYESFLSRNYKKDEEELLLKRWNKICPVQIVVQSQPEWLAEAQQHKNFHGRIVQMRVHPESGMTTALGYETGLPTVMTGEKWGDRQFHNPALQRISESVLRGECVVQKGGGSIHIEKQLSDGTTLVCLHTQTDSRVWGIYDNATGILTWMGHVPSHTKWLNFIIEFDTPKHKRKG